MAAHHLRPGLEPPRWTFIARDRHDMREALDIHAVTNRVVVLASHGGATVDLLRDLLGDDELEARAPGIIVNGFPGAAITTLLQSAGEWIATSIGSTDHLPVDDRTGHIPA